MPFHPISFMLFYLFHFSGNFDEIFISDFGWGVGYVMNDVTSFPANTQSRPSPSMPSNRPYYPHCSATPSLAVHLGKRVESVA